MSSKSTIKMITEDDLKQYVISSAEQLKYICHAYQNAFKEFNIVCQTCKFGTAIKPLEELSFPCRLCLGQIDSHYEFDYDRFKDKHD